MRKKTILYFLTGLFILSILPLYIIGLYAHPSVDDYYYGVTTAAVWKESGSILQVIRESFFQMKETYNNWQGNFSAIFLMRLQPGIFGEQYYVITPFLLITSFIFSMMTFLYTFLTRCFHSSKHIAYAIAIILTFCAIQFTHVPSDSFYWYNGSIYYTFFFCLMLILFTFLILMFTGKNSISRSSFFIFSLPLAFIIGGGNYSTALFTTLILFLLCIWTFFKQNKTFIPLISVALLSLSGLIISMIAPGNSIRQVSIGSSSNLINTFLYSFAYGGYNIASSTTFPVLIMWIICIPLLYKIAKKSNHTFSHPFVFLVLTFGVFCSQGTALFYAQGLRMPYRMMNIIYFSYYIWGLINLIYSLGWISQKYPNNILEKIFDFLASNIKTRNKFILITLSLFIIGCIGLSHVSENDDTTVNFSNLPTSISATYSLLSGEAQIYDTQLNQRNDYLSSTVDMDITLEPLEKTPYTIFHTDITTDPSYWKNLHMSLYYGKTSIKLSDE